MREFGGEGPEQRHTSSFRHEIATPWYIPLNCYKKPDPPYIHGAYGLDARSAPMRRPSIPPIK
jgi:hypothetical protein